MKKGGASMKTLLAAALCLLTFHGIAENATNQVPDSVAEQREVPAVGAELAKDAGTIESESGGNEPETEGECAEMDISLGESVDEAGRLFYLALAYECGDHGLEQDYAKAMRLYRESAEAGAASAMVNIGCMYRDGRGVVSNETRAVYWFEKAANAGDALGMHELAWAKLFGIGTERDLAGAKFLLLSNDKYEPSARLLRNFVKDQDVTRSLVLAVVRHGDRNAALECAMRYANGRSAEYDPLNAARFYAAYFYGDEFIASSRPLLGRAENGPSNSKLRELVDSSATNVSALVELARAYANPGYRIQDLSWSETLYFHLLEESDLSDQALRKELEKEHSALEDEMLAALYALNRAEGGDVRAMMEIGRRYLEGRGVSYNYSESIAWFKEALAAQDQAASQKAQGQAAQGQSVSDRQKEDSGRGKGFFAKYWRPAVGAIAGAAIGCVLLWLGGLLLGKIREWREMRRIDGEIRRGGEGVPVEAREIDAEEWDDPIPPSSPLDEPADMERTR